MEIKIQKILFNLRKKIDFIDSILFKFLIKRINLVKKILKIKKKYGIPIYSKKRENFILSKYRKKAEKIGISDRFIKCILKKIIRNSFLK